ncbi:hypothetical protein EON66_05320 [archaeon]|nr:MAG: hypothetical protein EON66_05320 [archaeon]
MCSTICKAIILRLWHNALNIVAAANAPSWPQVVLVYTIVLSISTDIILTIVLAFVSPDLVNAINALKNTVMSIYLAISFLGYWWLLRRSLNEIARLTRGRQFGDGDGAMLISDKALKKLRRVTLVSAVHTIGVLYKAGYLCHFALEVMDVISVASLRHYSLMIESFFYFFLSNWLPAVSMLIIMVKPRKSSGAGESASSGQQSGSRRNLAVGQRGGYTSVQDYDT